MRQELNKPKPAVCAIKFPWDAHTLQLPKGAKQGTQVCALFEGAAVKQ